MPHPLQTRVVTVGADVFGSESLYSVEERALRFFEEACELTRILGIDQSKMQEILGFEFDRPIGYSTIQEIGGAGCCLMAIAQVKRVDLLECIDLEISRVEDNKAAIQEKARKKPAFVHAVQPLQAAE